MWWSINIGETFTHIHQILKQVSQIIDILISGNVHWLHVTNTHGTYEKQSNWVLIQSLTGIPLSHVIRNSGHRSHVFPNEWGHCVIHKRSLDSLKHTLVIPWSACLGQGNIGYSSEMISSNTTNKSSCWRCLRLNAICEGGSWRASEMINEMGGDSSHDRMSWWEIVIHDQHSACQEHHNPN